MVTAKLKLSVDELGRGSAYLNDISIGDMLSRIEFVGAAGELTQIRLTIWAELDAEITAKLDQIALAKVESKKEEEGVRLLNGRILKPRPRASA